jgi:hypothetical protein
MNEEQEKAHDLLARAGLFYDNGKPDEADPDETEEERKKNRQTLNQNDVWCWGSAWGEYVPDEKLPELAALFRQYGWAGVLYYVSHANDDMQSEFEDNQRFIDFVRNEQRIRAEVPDYDERAYKQRSYMLGVPRCKRCWKPFADGDRYDFRPYSKQPEVVWKVCTECHLKAEENRD